MTVSTAYAAPMRWRVAKASDADREVEQQAREQIAAARGHERRANINAGISRRARHAGRIQAAPDVHDHVPDPRLEAAKAAQRAGVDPRRAAVLAELGFEEP